MTVLILLDSEGETYAVLTEQVLLVYLSVFITMFDLNLLKN